jgi:hypothetical protein
MTGTGFWRRIVAAGFMAAAMMTGGGGMPQAEAAPLVPALAQAARADAQPLAETVGWRHGGWRGHGGYGHRGWRGHRGYGHRGWARPHHFRPYRHYGRPYWSRPYRPYHVRAAGFYGPGPGWVYGPRCFWRPARYIHTPWGLEYRPARRICR